MVVLSANPVYAADEKTVAELQAEIARLKSALEKNQQELNAKTGVQAETTTSFEAAAPTATPQADEPQALDTVVVRSRNRIERLQDVPLSVSVVTGNELERLGAADIGAITRRAGNVSWNQGNQRTSSISIRGIGKIGQLEAQDPSVGVIADGVPLAFNPITSSYNFTDVDTVEVTRGPQGTLLGKNTSLGVINVTTKKPSFTPSADFAFTYGSRDTVIGRATAGGPVVDGLLAWRGGISVEQGKGDVINNYAYDADRTYTNKNRVTGKIQFLLTPNPDFTARLSLEATPVAGEYTNTRSYNTPTPKTYIDGTPNTALSNDTRVQRRWFTQNPSYYNYQRDYLSQGYIKVDGGYPLQTGNNNATVELTWNLGNHTLSSITGYRDYHFNAKNDEGTPFAVSTTGGVHDTYKQLSQEFRLSSQQGGFVDYQTGLFFIDTKTHYTSYSNWLQDAGAWYATNAQYATLDADGNGRYLLQNSVNGMFKKVDNDIHNRSAAAFGQLNWHLSEPLTLTTGVRLTQENRINPSSTLLINNGNGAELNPVTKNGIKLGGFSSDGTTGALSGTNSATQLSLADSVASKYFGVAAGANPGDAYNSLTAAQKLQVAAAKSLRNTQIGTLFATTQAQEYNAIQPNFVFSPSYKINENLTTYVSWQYGEKGGIAQVVSGVSKQAKAEKTSAYEWGLKSALFDKKLILNLDLYLMNISNYQQSVKDLDEAASTPGNPVYVSYTGNAKKVQAKGLEFDGVFSGIPHTTLRFSGAYNDARYKDFKNSPIANEQDPALHATQDLSGRTLAGAAKITWNVGGEFRYPVFGDKVFHTEFNTAYTSKYQTDVALSEYSWIPANYLTDFGIGIGKSNKSFDVTLLAKNVFDNKTHVSQSWNSFSPANSRWLGIQFTGKL